MPLSAGTRLGPHEIISPLGAGGMGEVYRARDTKLGREIVYLTPDNTLTETTSTAITLVVNWTAGLKEMTTTTRAETLLPCRSGR